MMTLAMQPPVIRGLEADSNGVYPYLRVALYYRATQEGSVRPLTKNWRSWSASPYAWRVTTPALALCAELTGTFADSGRSALFALIDSDRTSKPN
jgi:hypothetical protein